MKWGFTLVFLGMQAICLNPVLAEEVFVAVATNFTSCLRELVAEFEQQTGHHVVVSPGSTGKLYAQITNGAPFDVFLSADIRRPKLLEKEGLTVEESRFTYAIGRLTLWSSDPSLVNGDGAEILRAQLYRYLAIANHKTAPYGAAARQTLRALQLWDTVTPHMVQGENIGQTFQFVASGNAELGFVALSQVMDPKMKGIGSRWDVPVHLYQPIKQDAVLLTRGKSNRGARTLLDYLQGDEARTLIMRFGYDVTITGRN